MYLSGTKAIAALSAFGLGVSSWGNGSLPDDSLLKRTTVAPGVELRILPLGDSITYGFQDPDGNGYRLPLLNDLSGSKVLFVGDQSSGTMSNNENAGYSGYTINAIAGAASHAISSDHPNVILLHAGTNDMNASPPDASEPYDAAPQRLGSLIDQCIKGSPNAVILVAQIINSGNPATNARVQTFDAAIPEVVAQRTDAGHHVMVVDMRQLTSDEMADVLHPNAAGYKTMANVWLAGLQAVDAKGWIQRPVGIDPITVNKATCSKVQKSQGQQSQGQQSQGQQSQGQKRKCRSNPVWYNPRGNDVIATGVGHGGNGKFAVDWVPVPSGATGIGRNGRGVQFADLNGDGRADYLWVDETSGALIAYLNTGSGNRMAWAPVNGGKPIATGVGPRAGVRFADFAGNNKADYIFVDKAGRVQVYTNGGAIEGGWLWVGPKLVATGVFNANQQNVFFPDINGDGRADYVLVGDKGDVYLWLNVGSSGSYDITWVPQGQIATGLGTRNISLVDLSGDGRADYLIWDYEGGLTGYLNIRGRQEGIPIWLDQGPDKAIALGTGTEWEFCRLADFNGDGKVDYATISVTNGAVGSLYINNGQAGTDVTGDGIILKDMDNDGIDDYVFCDETGVLTLYFNKGPSNNGWVWVPASSAPVASGVGAKREQVRLAYIYGHGRADYVVVDDKTGAINVWENGGPDPSAPNIWIWTPRGEVATGIGAGAGVRFADIDGDGRDDYIWLSETGAATIYINAVGLNPANWVALNDGKPVATGVGALRRDIRFADIDGDGRADYIWVHPLDGSVEVWRNNAGNSPSSINWVPYPQKVATGVFYAGANVQFAFINKPRTGRADYVAVEPSTGALRVWLNDCGDPDLAPAASSSTDNGNSGSNGNNGNNANNANIGDCVTNPSPSGGSSGPEQSANPLVSPSESGSPASVVETSIPGITIPGVVTIGNPTLAGATPTGTGISSLQPLASQVAQQLASAESAIAAALTALDSGDVTSAEQALASAYQAVQVLLGTAQQINPQTVSGPDAQILQNLRSKLPPLLAQIGSAITQLAPSTHGTPNAAAIQQVAGLLGGSGPIGQAVNSIILPVATLSQSATIVLGGSTFTANSASQFIIGGQTLTQNGQITISGTPVSLEAGGSTAVIGGTTTPIFPGARLSAPASVFIPPSITSSSSSSSGGNIGGDGYGITIPDLTTVATASHIANFKSNGGSSAIDLLKPAARHGLNLLHLGLSALRGLSSSSGISDTSFPSDGLLGPAIRLFAQAAEDIGSIGQALESIELTDFSDDAKPQVQNLIDGVRNLLQDLIETVIDDAWRHKRTYGAIIATAIIVSEGSILTSLINYGTQTRPAQNSAQPTQTQCSQSIVTDYWVSCVSTSGGSRSCTTTSSSLASGCSIQASTTTTTGEACPTQTLDPNEDEGEDGDTNLPPSTQVSSASTPAPPPPPPPATTHASPPRPPPTTHTSPPPPPTTHASPPPPPTTHASPTPNPTTHASPTPAATTTSPATLASSSRPVLPSLNTEPSTDTIFCRVCPWDIKATCTSLPNCSPKATLRPLFGHPSVQTIPSFSTHPPSTSNPPSTRKKGSISVHPPSPSPSTPATTFYIGNWLGGVPPGPSGGRPVFTPGNSIAVYAIPDGQPPLDPCDRFLPVYQSLIGGQVDTQYPISTAEFSSSNTADFSRLINCLYQQHDADSQGSLQCDRGVTGRCSRGDTSTKKCGTSVVAKWQPLQVCSIG